MNLQDLRYLVAIAEHRHFGHAAEACHVSQPTLSTQLRKLEKELGVELVERSPRHVMLTEIGERIVERARIVLREEAAISEIARQSQDPEAGTIRVGLFPTLGPYLLPHVVPALHRRFPRLELLLIEEKTNEVLEHLRDGSLDIGVLALPVHDDRLHVEPLFDEDFVLAVPDDHPLATSAEPVTMDLLAGQSLLLLEDGHCLRDQALSVCHLSGASERGGFRATSLETLRQMVAAGVGITLLPELAVQPPVSAQQGVVIRRFTAPRPTRRIAICWRTSHPARKFFPQIAELFRDLPPGLASSSPR